MLPLLITRTNRGFIQLTINNQWHKVNYITSGAPYILAGIVVRLLYVGPYSFTDYKTI